eukprot:evm.model.NODE_47582_length_4217_cov_9.563908.2
MAGNGKYFPHGRYARVLAAYAEAFGAGIIKDFTIAVVEVASATRRSILSRVGQ